MAAGQAALTTAGKAAVGTVAAVVGSACFVALGLLMARIVFVRARVKAMTIHPDESLAPALARRSLPAPSTGRSSDSLLAPLSRSASAPITPSAAWIPQAS